MKLEYWSRKRMEQVPDEWEYQEEEPEEHMKYEPLTITIDRGQLHREMSRKKFTAMPKQKRISDKRNRSPKYKTDYTKGEN